jgi:hypothetical protein
VGAEIDTGDGPARAAITHDGSATGLLLLTRSDLAIGQTIKLNVFFVEGESRILTGKVVRQEQLDPEENTLWRSKVAVDLDEPNPELAAAFMALAKQQEKIYGSEED